MTASGFSLARTTPIRGRALLEEDERSDARVVVIAYDEWQRRFAADPGIIGRNIGLGADRYTIVGVMPEGFRFPVDDRYWIPLVLGKAERDRANEIPVTIVGRLAEGATLERAQAELTTIGSRMAAASPVTHERLRSRVLPYTRAFFDIEGPEMQWTARLFRLFASLLLVVVAVNVAVLTYARTATRAGEIAIRTALGASRSRVVTQLFAEALTLSVTAAVIGLAISGIVLGTLQTIAERRLGELPFWINLTLSPTVVAYSFVLAVLGAAIVGAAPALKATGKRVQLNLQRLSGGGATRMQLGRGWTALIVGQVAVAVAVLPFAAHFTQEAAANATTDVGYAAAEFLETTLDAEPADALADTASQRVVNQRFRMGAAELVQRLKGDPAVAGLTIRNVDGYERFEVDDPTSRGTGRRENKRTDRIDTEYFALYDIPILSGRTFIATDMRAGATAAVVNKVFADDYLGESAPLGRRLRFLRETGVAGEFEPGPWLEIVGVVRDFASNEFEPQGNIYLPMDAAELSAPIRVAIRVRNGAATSFVSRLREIGASVDPQLELKGVIAASERYRQGKLSSRSLAIGTTAAMLSVLLLSAAGIYAMMSFTVARRRREIGIRSALGANSRRVLGSIFARASMQIGAGILIGVIGAVALDRATGRGPVNDGNFVVVPLVAALMATAGLIATILPARRGLAVHPTEALRSE